MRLFAWIRKLGYTLTAFVHKFQTLLLSLMVIGIVDYFFLYELLLALSPMALEAAPIILIVLTILAVRGVAKYAKRKSKEKKHFFLLG